MSQARQYAEDRLKQLRDKGESQYGSFFIEELALAYAKGAADAKEKAVQTIQVAIGVNRGKPVKKARRA